jgi:hypothetical protein
MKRKELQRLYRLVEAARPKSGFQPQTPAEERQLQEAIVALNTFMLEDQGMPQARAKELAQKIYGGPDGLRLMKLAFGMR